MSEFIMRKIRREIWEDLVEKRKQKEHNEKSLYRLQNEKQPFPVKILITNIKIKIQEIDICIIEMEKKIESFDNGEYNEQMHQLLKKNKEEQERKAKITKIRKEKDKIITKNSPQHYKKEKKQVSEKEMCIEYDRYLKTLSKFPQNLKEKLKKMPENRGFIWRGIYFYGEVPVHNEIERNKIRLSERREVNGNVEFWEHIFEPEKGSCNVKKNNFKKF